MRQHATRPVFTRQLCKWRGPNTLGNHFQLPRDPYVRAPLRAKPDAPLESKHVCVSDMEAILATILSIQPPYRTVIVKFQHHPEIGSVLADTRHYHQSAVNSAGKRAHEYYCDRITRSTDADISPRTRSHFVARSRNSGKTHVDPEALFLQQVRAEADNLGLFDNAWRDFHKVFVPNGARIVKITATMCERSSGHNYQLVVTPTQRNGRTFDVHAWWDGAYRVRRRRAYASSLRASAMKAEKRQEGEPATGSPTAPEEQRPHHRQTALMRRRHWRNFSPRESSLLSNLRLPSVAANK